jgi:hypothetical protein
LLPGTRLKKSASKAIAKKCHSVDPQQALYADFRGGKFVNLRTNVIGIFQMNVNFTGRLPSQGIGTGSLSRAASRSTGL